MKCKKRNLLKEIKQFKLKKQKHYNSFECECSTKITITYNLI